MHASIRKKEFIEGSIKKRSIIDIWNDPDSFEWNRDLKKDDLSGFCGRCKYGSVCLGGCGNTRLVMSVDTGPGCGELELVWPESVRAVDAIFVTHVEAEHVGGLKDAVRRFGVSQAFIPAGADAPPARPMGEGEKYSAGTLEITAFRTPGHCAMHNCYSVRSTAVASARSLLISGDLVFAGSAGGPYHCHRQLRAHLCRVLAAVPPETVVAPGHGPMTTAGNELRFNPFVT